MTPKKLDLIKQAYAAFNTRDADAVLSLMKADVHWPNGWEGGYVEGKEEVKKYWTRQWQEINPHVEPVAFTDRGEEQTEVEVHQTVKDLDGNVLMDGIVKHVYTFENDSIKSMEIEKA